MKSREDAEMDDRPLSLLCQAEQVTHRMCMWGCLTCSPSQSSPAGPSLKSTLVYLRNDWPLGFSCGGGQAKADVAGRQSNERSVGQLLNVCSDNSRAVTVHTMPT